MMWILIVAVSGSIVCVAWQLYRLRLEVECLKAAIIASGEAFGGRAEEARKTLRMLRGIGRPGAAEEALRVLLGEPRSEDEP